MGTEARRQQRVLDLVCRVSRSPDSAIAQRELSRNGLAKWKVCARLVLVFVTFAACAKPQQVAEQPVARIGATSSPAAQTSPPDVTPTNQDFAVFWAKFREAALNDPKSLVKFTRFPFITDGETDDDPERAHDEQSFLGIIDILLADDVGGPGPETHREYFLRNEVPPKHRNG
jgi:hypothetical protein